jgi:glycosyltransferase involved in cell wall biosynthesis
VDLHVLPWVQFPERLLGSWIMKIGIDIKALRVNSTGIARYLREILYRLQEIDTKNQYFLFDCRSNSLTTNNASWKIIVTKWKLPGIVWQQFYLPFLLRKYHIDILWAPEQICPVFFMRKVKVITTIHDLTPQRYPETCQWSVVLINKLLFKAVIQKSSLLIVVSTNVQKDFLAQFHGICSSRKVVAVPHGKPLWQVPPTYAKSGRQRFLFFAGNTEPRKNLVGLIKALEILKRKGVEIGLQLAGPSGWKNTILKKYIERSCVKEQIKHLGYLNEDELKSKYLTCTAFVYPSIYEGFGLPILEALCLDCLILTSKNTVMEEIAGSCAVYFNPFNIGEIAERIETVFSPDFDRRLILKNKDNVLGRFSWDKTARTLLEKFHHESCF